MYTLKRVDDLGNLLTTHCFFKSFAKCSELLLYLFFSKLPPSPKDAPNAVQLGNKFTKIEILNEPLVANEVVINTAPMIEVTNDDEDNSNEKIFSEENKNPLKPTELMLNPGSLTETTPQFDINSPEEKSRRFSKLPPAPIDDPNAVQLGAKFTIIRQNSSKKEQ